MSEVNEIVESVGSMVERARAQVWIVQKERLL